MSTKLFVFSFLVSFQKLTFLFPIGKYPTASHIKLWHIQQIIGQLTLFHSHSRVKPRMLATQNTAGIYRAVESSSLRTWRIAFIFAHPSGNCGKGEKDAFTAISKMPRNLRCRIWPWLTELLMSSDECCRCIFSLWEHRNIVGVVTLLRVKARIKGGQNVASPSV